MRPEEVRQHFDQLAPRYDRIKQKNAFYLESIKEALKERIPPRKRILDFGCGTGEILAFLQPSVGVGYDISGGMIKQAQLKFGSKKNLRFTNSLNQVSGPFDSAQDKPFDFILMVDVVEHLASPEAVFESLVKFSDRSTKLIVSFVGSSWEPVLWLLERLGLKMPEGPHQRLSEGAVLGLAEKFGFSLVEKQKVRLFRSLPLAPITFFVFAKRSPKSIL